MHCIISFRARCFSSKLYYDENSKFSYIFKNEIGKLEILKMENELEIFLRIKEMDRFLILVSKKDTISSCFREEQNLRAKIESGNVSLFVNHS